ncbi:4Fe-4S binding protein [Desulfospira joergensenii]|uniref:4Fe-4S binding protein n=1 Tax=Desulfospira joergensenii TaxID=53329 RepID=UPI0003B4511C|nr:4Fe-4S binding protein [Desulfospira joergensenii]
MTWESGPWIFPGSISRESGYDNEQRFKRIFLHLPVKNLIRIRLKTLRRIVSLGVLILCSFLFLDLHGIFPPEFFRGVLFFQFIPSLLKFFTPAGTGAAGFILVILLTGIAGRIYCSFLCPLGGIQDVILRFRFWKKKKKMRFSSPWNRVRYSILFLTLASLLLVLVFSGSMVMINILDPYSNFGRIMAVLARPVAGLGNNGLAKVLSLADLYWIMPVSIPVPNPGVISAVLVFVLILAVLVIRQGRIFCNTLCPVGIFLGWISRFSLLKLVMDPDSCTGCGKCERVCRAGCMDPKNKQLDFQRCVSCFDCLEVCPEGSVSFQGPGKKKGTCLPLKSNGSGSGTESESVTNPGRRAFMALCALGIAGFHRIVEAAVKPVVYVKNKIPVKRKHPVLPPGALSLDHFTSRCTACHLCVTVCPGHVIQPELGGFGTRGILMPRMNNAKGYCNFKCTRCGEVCPTGAVLALEREAKQQVQIGKVVFIRENCIVVTQKTECGACSEHCPTKAVTMEKEGGLRVPKVHPDICVGCGACEHTCPALPHKSIYVEGNPVHLRAEKPRKKSLEAFDPDKGFPF